MEAASAWRAPQSDLSAEECATAFHPSMEIVFPHKGAKSEQQRGKSSKHGPEYDFTLEEILPSVHDVQGWHPQISEKEVSKILAQLMEKDGHFLFFYWNKKRRPAFSITFKGKIKTYIIHKKPTTRTGSEILYFIDHRGPYDKNLKNLINHHLENGIVERSSQDIIPLSYPVCFEGF